MTPEPLNTTPTGDPEAMRATARAWMARAAQLDELAAVISSTVGDMGLRGPAAERIAAACYDARGAATQRAGELHALASHLLADAGLVEELRARARAEAEHAAREEAEDAKRQQAAGVDRSPEREDRELPGGRTPSPQAPAAGSPPSPASPAPPTPPPGP